MSFLWFDLIVNSQKIQNKQKEKIKKIWFFIRENQILIYIFIRTLKLLTNIYIYIYIYIFIRTLKIWSLIVSYKYNLKLKQNFLYHKILCLFKQKQNLEKRECYFFL